MQDGSTTVRYNSSQRGMVVEKDYSSDDELIGELDPLASSLNWFRSFVIASETMRALGIFF